MIRFFNTSAVMQRKAGIVLGYINIIVKNLVSLFYTPLLLAFVGQGDYGVFEMANSFIYSLTLLSFGFSGAYVRFYMQRAEKGDDAAIRRLNGMYLLLYAVISIVVLVAGLGCSTQVGLIFSGGLTASEVTLAGQLMVVMSFNVAVTLFGNVFNSYITARERFSFQQSRQTLTTLATPFLSLALLWLGFGVIGVAFAQLTVNVVLLALNIVYSLRSLQMRFTVREREKGLFKALAVFSTWVFLNQVCDLVNNNVPNVMLGALCSSATVAVFAIALKIRTIFISLSTTLSNVFVPLVNQVVAKSNDNAELTRIMTKVGRYQAMLLLYIYGGFAVVGRWFVSVWAGPEFLDAYWLTLAMVAPLLVPLCQNVGIEIQRAKNMHRARSLVYIVMAVINVALTWLLAPRMGYWAPALAYVLSMVVGNCLWMNWYYVKRVELDILHYWKRVLPVVGAMAGAVLLCLAGTKLLLAVDSFLAFVLWGVVYSLLYVALLWAVALAAGEKASVMGRLRKLVRGRA